jgi:hypothetical protein
MRALACGVRRTDANFVQMGVVPYSDMTITAAPGCLAQTFEVHPRLTKHAARIEKPKGDRFDVSDTYATVQVTPRRGAAAKVVVTFGH